MIKKSIQHGFSIANIAILILLMLILWGIKWGATLAPQIRATANKVVQLNNLSDVDLKIGGCIPIRGSL